MIAVEDVQRAPRRFGFGAERREEIDDAALVIAAID